MIKRWLRREYIGMLEWLIGFGDLFAGSIGDGSGRDTRFHRWLDSKWEQVQRMKG